MRLPRKCSITHHTDFVRIRKTGQAKVGRFVIVNTLADPVLPSLRVAFVTSRRAAKKAHDRNLIRRRLRSYLQIYAPVFSDPKRYLITIARPGAAEASSVDLKADWLRQCQRLKLIP